MRRKRQCDGITITRTARVVWRLAHGARMTIRDVCTLTGLTPSGAYYLMSRLACSDSEVPVALDDGVYLCIAPERITGN